MVNQKLVAISYCSAFLLIYVCAIAYAIIPAYANKYYHTNIDTPEIQSYNTTVNAVYGLGSYASWSGIVMIVLITIFVLFGLTYRTMGQAY
jgi:hypothetical protein